MGNGMKVLGFGVLGLVAMQMFPVQRTNPPPDRPLAIQDPMVSDIVERACADCHSHDTVWPWYSRIAPVSWWVVDHVEEGREHLNFSTWGTQPPDRQEHKLEEVVEYVENREMPLRSYVAGHPEARITDAERESLVDWANDLRAQLRGSGEADLREPGDDEDEGRR